MVTGGQEKSLGTESTVGCLEGKTGKAGASS